MPAAILQNSCDTCREVTAHLQTHGVLVKQGKTELFDMLTGIKH